MDVDNKFAQKILTEQFKFLYKTTLPNMLANLVVGCELVVGLWSYVAHRTLLIWIAILILAILIRLTHYLIYHSDTRPESLHRHSFFNTLSGITFGLIWGLGVYFFSQNQLIEHQFFLFFIAAGMAAGALSSLTYYLPTFLFFLPLSVLPMSAAFFRFGDANHLLLSFMPIIYIAGMSIYAVEINKTFKTSLLLRFKNAELMQQLREQKEIADAANKAKSKFLAEASHDLRQPLYALTLFTETLNHNVKDPKTRALIENMSSTVNNLQGLFNHLLDISRYEVGAQEVNKIDFNLANIFAQLANDFNSLAQEKGLAIRWPTDVLLVFSDPNLVAQILRNYVSNAIRYTEEGGIKIHCECDERYITIHVTDTGIGIAPENQQLIFEEFNQLQNANNQDGTGLGLAIVKRVAKILNNPISLTSSLNKGSTFSISLERSAGVNLIANEQSFDQVKPVGSLSAFVVVIDDEEMIRLGTKNLLSSWGCRVLTAASIADALAQLKNERQVPDAIIADYRLADNKTGVDAIANIRTQYEKIIPALILSGDIGVDGLPDVVASQLQVLTKPASKDNLYRFLHDANDKQKPAE